MAACRQPGPLCQTTAPVHIEDGTTLPAVGASAAPLGLTGDSVADWPAQQKLMEAARRTTSLLPPGMRDEFAALFTTENAAMTAGIFAVWGGSHLVGVGEVADVLLAVVGVAVLGTQALGACKDVTEFVRIATSARSSRDLDEAAGHLARAAIILGVTTLLALIFKHGGRMARAVVARESLCGASLDWWLAKLGRADAPEFQRANLKTALEFFEHHKPAPPRGDVAALEQYRGEIAGKLEAIDLKSPVEQIPLDDLRRMELVRYGSPTGEYFTRAGTPLDRVGKAEGAGVEMRTIGQDGSVRTSLGYTRFRVKENAMKGVTVLKSRAAEARDTWTRGRKPTFTSSGRTQTLAGGGAVQYVIPNSASILEAVPRPMTGGSRLPPSGR